MILDRTLGVLGACILGLAGPSCVEFIPPPAPAPVTVVPVVESEIESEVESELVIETPPASRPVAPPARAVAVAVEGAITALALGENHTCSLSSEGRVRCWGYNKGGSLGVGATADPADGMVAGIGGHDRVVVHALVAGGYQTCALTSDQRVWCWGVNHMGQVGNGSASESPVTRPVRVRGLEGVRSLYAGDATTCAIDHAARVSCWGSNSHGQIASSNRKPIATPVRVPGFDGAISMAIGNYHICAVIDGRVQCQGELSTFNQALASLTEVTEISAGWGHSCALQHGKAYCWGTNYLGVLGLGHHQQNAAAPRGPIEVPGLAGAATQLVGRDYHTCVLLESGRVACWGNNQGHAFSDTLPAEPGQAAHILADVDRADAVYVGGVHTCILRAGVASCRGNDWAGAVRGAAW